MLRLSFLFVALTVCVSRADDSLLRIEERLTTDRDFYDQWMDLIALQALQSEEQSADYPLSYSLDDVTNCQRRSGDSMQNTDALRPEDIAIYAEMGHLSTYCRSNYSTLNAGLLDSCVHKGSSMSLPSMDKLIRLWNPNLTVIDANERDDLLSEQARNLGEAIRELEGYEHVWKMIVIIPSIQDGEASETGQTAVEVLSSIEELHKLLPSKTMVIVLRSSGSGIWRDASHSHKACRDILSRWKVHNKFNSNSVWDQVEVIVQKNFQKSNFSVEILPLLREAALTNLPNGADMSVLGYDCAHFSERGLSLLHLSLWNTLMTRSGDRSHDFRPQPPSMRCPDPRCPFIRTAANSAYCIWNDTTVGLPSLAPQLMVVAVLCMAVLLALLVILCLCRRSPRTQDIKTPVKAFGASFSSIKFIDEDIV